MNILLRSCFVCVAPAPVQLAFVLGHSLNLDRCVNVKWRQYKSIYTHQHRPIPEPRGGNVSYWSVQVSGRLGRTLTVGWHQNGRYQQVDTWGLCFSSARSSHLLSRLNHVYTNKDAHTLLHVGFPQGPLNESFSTNEGAGGGDSV